MSEPLCRCLRCKLEKPRSDFTNDRKRSTGRSPYCRPCKNEYQRQGTLFWKFGITLEQYEQMLAEQGGVCAICKRPPDRRRLAVDHDHACCPGERTCGECNRGLLCTYCNGHVEYTIQYGHLVEAYLNG